jgi:myosin heavy subunit
MLLHNDVIQAKDTRDAFTKALYAHLFNRLIKMINVPLASGHAASTSSSQFIALLDIFGFEIFDKNRYTCAFGCYYY